MQQKVVRFDDVMDYVRVAPEEAIRMVYQECARRLSINVGDDSDGEGGSSNAISSAEDAMVAALGNVKITSGGSSLLSQLKEKVNTEGELDDIAPPDTVVRLKAVNKNEQYKTVDFEVHSPDVKAVLASALAKCKKIGAHFPFGYGLTKDLLRVSKCATGTAGKVIEVTIHFSTWAREGKKGITCYLKK